MGEGLCGANPLEGIAYLVDTRGSSALRSNHALCICAALPAHLRFQCHTRRSHLVLNEQIIEDTAMMHSTEVVASKSFLVGGAVERLTEGRTDVRATSERDVSTA